MAKVVAGRRRYKQDLINISCTPIRISEIVPWDRKSYLTHAILPRLSRKGLLHWLYWKSCTLLSSDVIVMLKLLHHVNLYLSVFRDFRKLILNK